MHNHPGAPTKSKLERGVYSRRALIGTRALNRIIAIMHTRPMTLSSTKRSVKPRIRGGKATKLVKDGWTLFVRAE